MAHVDIYKAIMAEAKVEGSRGLTEESTSSTGEISDFLTALEEESRTSSKDASGGAADGAASSSEYMSKRIRGMIESRTKYATAVEAEIESSKVHWTQLQPAIDGELESAQGNREVYRRLQQQYGKEFFKDWNGMWELGEKIAEGGQAEIFALRFLNRKYAGRNTRYVAKVMKGSLEDLQKQWPLAMLQKASTPERSSYLTYGGILEVLRGEMMKDGRFAFVMRRRSGDLRTLIDFRMQRNGNQAPPFSEEKAFQIMYGIANGMRRLHKANIIHRDLKASNVLIVWPPKWDDNFDVLCDGKFHCEIADFECSVGVVGTRFWRAPEILLGLKHRDLQAIIYNEKVDVYSYAMTCYEILTGKIPLEDLEANDYDAVINGARPILPKNVHIGIQSLLSRCWDCDPSKRPSFVEIVDAFEFIKRHRIEWQGRMIKFREFPQVCDLVFAK